MKRISILIAFLGFALMAAGESHAQQVSRTAAGPKVGFYIDAGKFMLGGVGEFLLTSNLYFEPGVEIVFGITKTTRIILDANGRYAFPIQGQTFSPFVLAGIGLRHDSYNFENAKGSETAFRINFGGGLTFSTRSDIQPWFGIKLFIVDPKESDVALQGGVNFYF